MRIIGEPPAVPQGFDIMATCHWCDDFARDFLILVNDEQGIATTICISCITKIVDAAAERFFVDSRA